MDHVAKARNIARALIYTFPQSITLPFKEWVLLEDRLTEELILELQVLQQEILNEAH